MESLSEQATELYLALVAHVTENRLHNVLSKIPDAGNLTKGDSGRLCGLLSRDALEDFKKDYGGALEELDPKERKAIQRSFGSEAMRLVTKHLLAEAK